MKNAMTPSATKNATTVATAVSPEREDAGLVPALEQLVEAAAEHRGDREQERVSRRGGTLVAHEETGGDRASRP